VKRVTTFISLSIFTIFLLPVAIFAQILNGGFEQWTGNTPDNWYVNNAAQLYTTVTQSNSSHSGSYALKGQVINFFNTPVSPIVASGDNSGGFSVSERYLSLQGFFQFTPLGGDELDIIVLMSKNGSAIGGGTLTLLNPVSVYTPFSVGITYFLEGTTPDTVWIEFAVLNSTSGTTNVGTEFLLDDLSLSLTPVSVENAGTSLPSSVILNQNYPNPFNPITTIGFFLPAMSDVSLTVYDVLGQVVDKLIDQQNMSIGYHSVQWKPKAMLPSGAYFYNLKAGSFSQTRRMLLIK
jgi:hypothetical protein